MPTLWLASRLIPKSERLKIIWRPWGDLNTRPCAPQAHALSAELQGHAPQSAFRHALRGRIPIILSYLATFFNSIPQKTTKIPP